MTNQELLNYIRQQSSQGTSEEEIKSKLITSGWSETDIKEAFALVSDSVLPPAPPNPFPQSDSRSPVFPRSSYANETHFNQESKSNPVKSIILAFIIIIIATVVSLAAKIWDPLWNPFRPDPDELISRMVLEMEKLDYLRSEVKIEISANKEGEKTFNFLIDHAGDYDNSDNQNTRTAGVFNIAGSSNGTQLTVSGENKNIGDISYIKLTTLPVIPEMPVDLNRLKNQWFKIDSESSRELFKVMAADAPREMQLMFGQMIEIQLEIQKEMQKEIEEKFGKLLLDEDLYLIRKKLPDGKIRNQKVYGYIVALNNKKLREVFLETMEIYTGIYLEKMFSLMLNTEMFPEDLRPPAAEIRQMKAEMEEAKEEGIKEMEKGLDRFFEKIGDIEGEIWVGKNDFYLYRVKMEKELDLAEFQPREEVRIMVKLNMDFSSFNEQVEVDAPKEYKGFEEVFVPLMAEIIEASLGEARLRAKDARIIANMSQFRALAEIYYSNRKPQGYVNFCTSEDAAIISKDVIVQGGMKFACHVQTGAGAGNSYCIKVQLNSGDWWCIDSDLSFKQYNTNPACAICFGKTCQCE